VAKQLGKPSRPPTEAAQGHHQPAWWQRSAHHHLAGGGAVIDAPDFKEFDLVDIDGTELSHYFPKMCDLRLQCGFHNCTHTFEPDCAVKQALEDGAIAESRFNTYLSMLEQLELDEKNAYK
jgi:ribosome small subunit-dependent GTPase A